MGLELRRIEVCLVVVLLATFGGIQAAEEAKSKEEAVITLDHSNFNDFVSKHDFILVEFYAPWCGFCKKLAPEYEKAAATLSKHDPPIPLAKIDLTIDTNKEYFKKDFEIRGYPTLKILRHGGKLVHDIENTPRTEDGIVELVKKFLGPASVEIDSANAAAKIIDEKKIFIAGVFPKYEGEEYENFTKLAEKLRSKYEFGHTLDAKFLPRGDSSVKGPIIRLLKPFDELFADIENFDLEAVEKFIEEEDVPTVVELSKDPSNTYAQKIFRNHNTKIMLFYDFKSKDASSLRSRYNDVALLLKGGNKFFLVSDINGDVGKEILEFYNLDKSNAPIIFIYETEATKYLETNVEPDQIAPLFKKYKDGRLKKFMKSQPIPLENNEPVKEVVLDSLQDMVFKSGKDVLLMFYTSRSREEYKKLDTILKEIALSYENDDDITIGKFDAMANDVPREQISVGRDYPALFFIKKNQEILEYKGGQTKEDIANFIEEHRSDKKSKSEAEIKSETQNTSDDHVDDKKDEL